MYKRFNDSSDYTPQGMLPLPSSSDSFIVFPYIRYSKTFDRSFYSPALTHGKASYAQIDQFLIELETNIQAKLKIVGGLSCIGMLVLVLMCVIYLIYHACNGFSSLESIFLPMLIYVILIFLAIYGMNKFSDKKYKEAREIAQRVIDSHEQAFAEQGLRWSLPGHFPRWVELYKDYQVQPYSSKGSYSNTSQDTNPQLHNQNGYGSQL